MLSEKFFKIKRYSLFFLVFCAILAFFMLLYFAFLKRNMIMVTNKICVADFINSLNNGNFINILIIPLSAFLVTVLSEYNCSSFNYYIRNKSRKNIILKRFYKIFIFSVVTVVLTLMTSVVVAGLFTSEFINWDKYESYYYLSRGTIIHIGFIKMMFCVFLKLFFQICFFSSLLCTICIACKKTIAFLIIILLSGTNVIGFITFIIDNMCSYSFGAESYWSFSTVVLIFVILPLMILASILASVNLVKRKDFLK